MAPEKAFSLKLFTVAHLKYSLKRLYFRKLDGMYTIGREEVDADGQKSLGGLGLMS